MSEETRKRLNQARTKIIVAACAYFPTDETTEPCRLGFLKEAVEEYRAAVKEDEKGRRIT
jgi:hypothetical protein